MGATQIGLGEGDQQRTIVVIAGEVDVAYQLAGEPGAVEMAAAFQRASR